MPLNRLGVLDLSIVTDRLIAVLTDCYDHYPLWKNNGGEVDRFAINITGAAPDTVRELGDCQLSVYLFHVNPDPYQRNSPVTGPRPQPTPQVPLRAQMIPFQPLSLDLYYLLSAFCKADFHKEQQAMSLALRCFHERPIVRAQVTIPVPPPEAVPEEFTLTMEVETLDTLSRLWQSITTSMRLAAIYKVSVVFITPPAPAAAAPPVRQIDLAADPSALPFAANGQLLGTYRKVSYTSPNSSAARPETKTYDSSAATASPGQTLIVYGAGLSDGSGNANPTAKRLYLVMTDGSEHEITNWIIPVANPTPPPATIVLDSRLTIQVPPNVGALPLNAPNPGVYQLRVGSDTAQGDTVTYRSNTVPLSIAAAVTVTTIPPNPPVLAGNSFTGVGFISGRTQMLLGPVGLSEGAPSQGNFQITGGTTINFQPPANLAHGLYPVRVRVSHVESDPSWWLAV
jgi:hypothetical protein